MSEEINWLDWKQESFQLAKKEDKPVLLAITAVWCHWCHVMHNVTYADKEIGKMITDLFIPVSVDVDHRPDIVERYAFGGFPTTAFLTPEGDILSGDTYMPSGQLKNAMIQISEFYYNNKNEIEKKVKENRKKFEMIQRPVRGEKILSTNIGKNILTFLEENFDPEHGGFGSEPKFPIPDAIQLFANKFNDTKESQYRDVIITTLEGIRRGLFDFEEGGFFRYSVTQDWLEPHYEKMLETNANLLEDFTIGYDLTKSKEFLKLIVETIDYLDKNLTDSKFGFYGSQDADEEYYKLSDNERKKKKAPFIDKTIYSHWNGKMISSYLKIAQSLNRPDIGEKAANFTKSLWDKLFTEGKGIQHYYEDGKTSETYFLGGQAYMLRALIDCFSFTSSENMLKRAVTLSEVLLQKYYDNEFGGFYDSLPRPDDIGMLKQKTKPFSENSVVAESFLRLYKITKIPELKEAAKKTLEWYATNYLEYNMYASTYALAVKRYLEVANT